MSAVFNILQAFSTQFNSEPFVLDTAQEQSLLSATGSVIRATYEGKEVLLPIKFVELPDSFENGELVLPWATITVSSKKNYIKTPLSQRRGTVRELYSVEDYKISISGFLIDLQGRSFPEEQIAALVSLFELEESISIDNALTNILLPDNADGGKFKHVVVTGLDFPPLRGGRLHARPFTLTLESDLVFTLEDIDEDV